MTDRSERQPERARQTAPDPALAAAAQSIDQARQAEMAKAAADAEQTTAEHEAVEGGHYIVGDLHVDANGIEIKARKKD